MKRQRQEIIRTKVAKEDRVLMSRLRRMTIRVGTNGLVVTPIFESLKGKGEND